MQRTACGAGQGVMVLGQFLKGQERVRKTSEGVPTVVYPNITARNILELV